MLTMTTRRHALRASGALLSVLTLTLAGCSVSVDPQSSESLVDRGSATSPSDSAAPTTPEESPDPADAAPEEPAAQNGTPEVLNVRQGDYQHTCDDSALIIEGGQAEVQVTGSCTSVTVNSRNTTIKIDSTVELIVSGSQGTVIVEQVQNIAVPGEMNTVKWRQGTPAVTDTGKYNSIIQMD